MGEERRCTKCGSSPCLFFVHVSQFGTVLMDGKMNNIIIIQHQKPWCFSPINLRVESGHQYLS